ncbi:MAG TPA: TraR/DksA C4-type zinc finger protein [Candidatus Baltobacteraceae bacterium]|jgi:DnaK suppressor protein|nr:TraR/DksA C4-type zinc finger protein [Candidatus Baltobacteraceae bacterium]
MGHIATATKRNSTPPVRSYDHFEEALLARKRELTVRIGELLGDVVVEGEPEDEGEVAIQNYSKDWAAGALERARRTLSEVDAALARIKAGDYGVCGACHITIPKARLEALPWARLCVPCAERNAGND